jgi:predicted CXXCH cytochrome family protein
MKRILSLVSGLALVLALASTAWGQGLSGTAHDLSGETWNTSGEICIVCHTPHNADGTVSTAPLWNHEVASNTYTLYSSSTLTATPGQPNDESLLCLSCHDGTVALDSFGGATGTNYIAAAGDVGTDLSDDHPVSFVYNATLATNDGGLYDPSTATTTLGGTIEVDLLFGTISGSMRLECASCHDAHDDAGNTALLRIDNAASAFCLTCHNK